MNHGFQLLQTLYTSAFGKYSKFKIRFDRAVQSGKFRKLSKRKRSSIISRLKKLFERLRSLKAQLRIAGAGLALSLTAAFSDPASAQGLGPFQKNDSDNPLPPPHLMSHPRVAMVDIDNDGDMDSFVGNADGDILFFRNDSPEGTVRRFVQVTGSDNPLNGVNKGIHASPAFADIDNDGDMDMYLGINYANSNPPGGPFQYDYSPTFFFRNTGSAANPVFTEQTGAANPFNGIYAPKYGAGIPVFVDIDKDGDVDLFLGGRYSSDPYGPNPGVLYFQNQGTASTPNFVPTTHPLIPSIEHFRSVALAFADLDNDGDLDALVGQYAGWYGIKAFRNDGASFTELTGGNNPAYSFYARYGSPAFADLDGDNDLDLVVGQTSSSRSAILYAENTGSFELQHKDDLNISPFGGVDVGNDAAVTFVDIDNDGDLDALIGSKYSTGLTVFLNNEGVFIADPDNAISDVIDGNNVAPSFVDIDNDGDFDLFYGGRSISFYTNTGTAANPTFVEGANLFPSLNSGNSYDLTISFIDLDGDGDFDALIGNDDYENRGVSYYKNTGSASNPVFALADTPEPFNADLFEQNPNVVAVDLDNDGDLDLAVTETYYNGWYGDSNAGRTWFYENKGDGNFKEMANPLINELTPYSITSFADADGDGDLDAFVGNGYSFDLYQDGRVTYYENTNPPPSTLVSNSIVSVPFNTPVVLDPDISINDTDGDDIVLATITLSDFVSGSEELSFTPSAGVTGEFEGGVLTITGRATLLQYETILRTVTYQVTGNLTSGARMSGRAAQQPQDKTVTFSVRDTDFTETIVSVVSVISLQITEPGIVVYNAVSAGVSPGLNDYMRITGLPANNKVSIFNRWGDKVFEVSQYDNATHKFEGKNDNGKDLPSGTYFYEIEADGKTITGYLSLKR